LDRRDRFIAGIIARFISPGPNELGAHSDDRARIASAFVATFIGQSIGWYRLDQVRLIGATVGALLVLSFGIGCGQPRSNRSDPGPRPPRRCFNNAQAM